MPNNFETALDVVIRRDEGGYVLSNVAGDSGGQTYAGIARNKWPKWAGWAVIDAGQYNEELLRVMVVKFYYDNFLGEWFDATPSIDTDVAVKLLSMVVNMGISEGIKLLQRSVNYLKPGGQKLVEDGKAGSLTRYWLNRCLPEELLAELRARSAWFYHETIHNNAGEEEFALGWMRRAAR